MESKSSDKIILSPEHFFSSFNRKNKTLVFTNGCFDLLHAGHIHLLEAAKKLGDVLIIGINSDTSVKKLKGNTRPIETLELRMQKLSELKIVDFIIPFSDETPLQLMKILLPDILVKGGDYKANEIVGNTISGRVEIIPILEGYSTTNEILKRNKK